MQRHSKAIDEPSTPFTHVVSSATEYYSNPPRPKQRPDGRLQGGTRVTVVRQQGTYSLIDWGGIAAYVPTAALRASSEKQEEQLAALVQGNNQFALELLAALGQSASKNLFFSPYSLSSALAMTFDGARGATADQMAQTLHFPAARQELESCFQALGQILASGQGHGYELAIANRLWGQDGYQFLPEFLQSTRLYYGAALAEVDFLRHTEQARQQINQWVTDQTRGKIVDLIPSGGLDPRTRLVLTNAIYFKGDWTQQFEKANTKQAAFHVAAGKSSKVPLMFAEERFGYAEDEEVQLLEMSYGNEDLSMLVLLPRDVDGLAKLQQSLSSEKLANWLVELVPRPVEVFFPRFKLTDNHELKEALSALGMPLAFSRDADFTGMTIGETLAISAVLHKAYVDVNEKGTEAAAATGVMMMPTAAPPPREIPVFRADHPFLFLVRDRRTDGILFVGRLINPDQS